MKIEAHVLCWNESQTIALTAKHYKSFCHRVIFYDNFSDDNTRDIVRELGCEAQVFGIAGELNDSEYLKVKNNSWKGSKADWVIVCDADEILFSEFGIKWELQEANYHERTIIRPMGYNMFSNEMPVNDWTEINKGVYDVNYCKMICFNPQKITDINYIYGCHEARPKGEVWPYNGGMKLLHYKHVGGAERLAKRHALYAARLSQINKKWALGAQYCEPREKTIRYFHEHLEKSTVIF